MIRQKRIDEFLSIAAHEIRTPITVIKAQAQLAQRFRAQGRFEGEAVDRALATFVRESDRLARLCSDLLEVARIDGGLFQLHPIRFELDALIRDVAAELRPDSHDLRLDLEEGLLVDADRERVAEVVFHLLSNAIRFSPDGGAIEVRARHEGAGFRVSVRDQGVGIRQERIGKIFDRYFSAHREGLKGPSGLGIGLYLSREILRRMGGRIWARSEGPGRGAEFILEWGK